MIIQQGDQYILEENYDRIPISKDDVKNYIKQWYNLSDKLIDYLLDRWGYGSISKNYLRIGYLYDKDPRMNAIVEIEYFNNNWYLWVNNLKVRLESIEVDLDRRLDDILKLYRHKDTIKDMMLTRDNEIIVKEQYDMYNGILLVEAVIPGFYYARYKPIMGTGYIVHSSTLQSVDEYIVLTYNLINRYKNSY